MSRKALALTGKRFSRLAVIRHEGSDESGRSIWLCRCDCGAEKVVKASYLVKGTTKSCGCAADDQRRANGRRQCHDKSKAENPGEYSSWWNMISRCHDPRNKQFHTYGARGVAVCSRWRNSFAAFLADMGPRPPGTSLDRLSNANGYTKSNCRWASSEAQANNRGNNRLITIQGRTMTVKQWINEIGTVSEHAARQRLHMGWDPLDALTRPLGHRRSRQG